MKKGLLWFFAILGLVFMGLGALLLTDQEQIIAGAVVLFCSTLTFGWAEYQYAKGRAITKLPPKGTSYVIVSVLRWSTSVELLLRDIGEEEIFRFSLGLTQVPEEAISGNLVVNDGSDRLVLLEKKISSGKKEDLSGRKIKDEPGQEA